MLPAVLSWSWPWPAGPNGQLPRHGVERFLIGLVLHRLRLPAILLCVRTPARFPITMTSADSSPALTGEVSPGKGTVLLRTAA